MNTLLTTKITYEIERWYFLYSFKGMKDIQTTTNIITNEIVKRFRNHKLCVNLQGIILYIFLFKCSHHNFTGTDI